MKSGAKTLPDTDSLEAALILDTWPYRWAKPLLLEKNWIRKTSKGKTR